MRSLRRKIGASMYAAELQERAALEVRDAWTLPLF
jgi:hypothetical protein